MPGRRQRSTDLSKFDRETAVRVRIFAWVIVLVAVLALCALAAKVSHAPTPATPSLPHRTAGLDPQGHLPAYIADMCGGHVQEVIKQPSGGYLVLCRTAQLTTDK